MTLLEKSSQAAAIVTIAAASLCLLFLMCIVVADVVLRAIDPNWRIFGMLDYVELSLDWMVFMAIPAALFSEKIITVDLIDTWDKHALFPVVGSVTTVIALGMLLSQVFRPGLDVLEFGEQTLDLGIPKFYYWLAIWSGIALALCAAVIRTIKVIREKLK